MHEELDNHKSLDYFEDTNLRQSAIHKFTTSARPHSSAVCEALREPDVKEFDWD